VKSNQKIKNVPKIEIAEIKFISKNPFADKSNYKALKWLKYALEAETEIATKQNSVMGIETSLDTMSIALQNKKEKNQKSSSKQKANITPLFVKGTKPKIQNFNS